MAETRIECPHCRRVGKTTRHVPPGTRIKCPGCLQAFQYDGADHVAYDLVSPEPEMMPLAQITTHAAVAQGLSPPAHVVNVTVNQGRGNGAAVGALVLGILACLVCWVPFLGLLSWPFAGLALLLGTVGVTLALATKRTGVTSSLIGMALGAAAVVTSLVITNVVSQKIAVEMKKGVEREKQEALGRNINRAAFVPKAVNNEHTQWSDAPGSVEVGDVRISV